MAKKWIKKSILYSLLFVTTTLYSTIANSTETNDSLSPPDIQVSASPEQALLNKANAIILSDQKTSKVLARQALQLSETKNNNQVSAEAHSLLGKLTNASVEKKHHFLQAATLYKKANDKLKKTTSTIDYAFVFVAEKRYDEADQILNNLLVTAQQDGGQLSIALTLLAKADSYYQQKHYKDAIAEYQKALTFLTGSDKTIGENRARTYTKMAQSYKRLKNRKQTAFFYEKSLSLYAKLKDDVSMARTLNTLAEAERYLGHYVIALNYSNRSLAIHSKLNDPEGKAKALTGAGIIYRYIGRYEKSLQHIHQAYLYYKKTNNINGIAKTSNQMGLIYSKLNQHKLAESFYQVTIDLPKDKVEAKTLASALREMAVVDLKSHRYKRAKTLIVRAYNIYKKSNDANNQSLSARIIGNIYRDQKDTVNAIFYYRQSLQLAKQVGSKMYQIKVQIPLAKMLFKKQPEKAIILLKQSLVLATEINFTSHQLYAYRSLRKAEKALGNISESLHYAEKEIKLIKVIQKEREDNQFILEKAKLHSHKIEMELEALKEKNLLDKLELAKKSNEIEISNQAMKISELQNKYVYVALASLLLLCFFSAVFIYLRFVDSRKRNKELDYLAARDPLTGCYNRRVLFELMNQDFEQLTSNDEYCVIMVDIDTFKEINDTHGHSVGDNVIRDVAKTLQGDVRKNDIVARFGGEEFCIILHDVTEDKAMYIANAMCLKIASADFNGIPVTCSFGLSSIKFNAKKPTQLIDQADLALYKSKTNGRNQVTLWDQKLEEHPFPFCKESK